MCEAAFTTGMISLNCSIAQFETRHKSGQRLQPAHSLQPHQHPKTGDSDKFFVGDRFHEKNVSIQMIIKENYYLLIGFF